MKLKPGGKQLVSNGLLVLLCSVVGDVPSGGDLLVLELVRRWPVTAGPVRVLTSSSGRRHAVAVGLANPEFDLLPGHGPRVESSALLAYIIRSIEAPLTVWRAARRELKARARFVLSASPFAPDVTAAIAARVSGMEWIQSWQLVIPPPWVRYEDVHTGPKGAARKSFRRILPRIMPAFSYLSQEVTLALARRWCRTLLIPSRLMAAEAIRRGFSKQQIHVTGLGVNFTQIRSIVTPSEGEQPRFDAVFLGRFHAQKGLDDLVSVWTHVLELRASARLAVIGDGHGREAAQFKAQLARLPVNSVSQLGVLIGPEKYRALSRAKLLIFPSHHESWGHVVIEAMASGLPVIGYDLPSSREAFGDQMVMVPLGDTVQLSSAVNRLLDDPGLYLEYQRRGIEFARAHDWDRIAEAFFERLREVAHVA